MLQSYSIAPTEGYLTKLGGQKPRCISIQTRLIAFDINSQAQREGNSIKLRHSTNQATRDALHRGQCLKKTQIKHSLTWDLESKNGS